MTRKNVLYFTGNPAARFPSRSTGDHHHLAVDLHRSFPGAAVRNATEQAPSTAPQSAKAVG